MVAFTSTSPLEVSDFSGGKTDYYLNSDLNRFQHGDNLLILKHGQQGKLFTRPGSEIYDATAYRIPTATRINAIKIFLDELWTFSVLKLYYIDGTHVELVGPGGFSLFTGTSSTTLISFYEWKEHLFITNSDFSRVSKIYKDAGGTRHLRTAGLPRPGSTPTLTPSGGGPNSYLYRIIHSYQYVSGDLTFLDRGGFRESQITGVAAVDGVNPITVSSLVALSNGADLHYDTGSALLKTEIYRTTANGTVFYFVGSVPNGTTSYLDTTDDTTLQTNPLLYTEGGLPENIDPPLCKVLHIMDDKAYYAHTKVGSEINKNRLYQSSPGDIDSVPELNFVEVQDEIVGISSVRSSPIVFCKDFIYRLDGAFDIVGQGFINPDKISDTAGCVSHNSIVQTVLGVFWAGKDGFYYTDGYRVFKISDDIDETYQELVKDQARKDKIQGVFDAKKLRIWWTVQSSDGATDNDSAFVLDLNWGVKPSMPFTTASGESNFAPTFLEFEGEDLLRADSRGYVFRHKDTIYIDPTVDVGALPSTWGESTILYNYTSAATNFGTSSARKFVPRILVECSNETNLSLQITSINDDGRREDDLKPIRYRGQFSWGDPDVYWGDPTKLWGNQGLILHQRRFPAKGLRCQYKQVRFSNATVAILSSDLIGTASVDNVLKQVTLDDTTSYDWPTLAVDLSIAFPSDNYVREYKITARTDDVLTYSDATNLSPLLANTKWVLRGKPKNEIIQIVAYSIDFMIFGRTAQLFRSGGTGEVST